MVNYGSEIITIFYKQERFLSQTEQMTLCDVTTGHAVTVACARVLRAISGRRTVHEGWFEGKPVIIKCFTSALRGRHHYYKEINGYKQLTLRKIKTAQIAAAGKNERGDYVIVLEKIDPASDVFSLLETAGDDAAIRAVLREVFLCLARMHAAGVRQKDLHTGNFLWDGNSIYVLDPAEITFYRDPLEQPASFDQLAKLFASLSASFRTEMSALLGVYFEARGWTLTEAAKAAIRELMEAKQLGAMRHRLRKSLRTSKRYIAGRYGPYRGVISRELLCDWNSPEFVTEIDRQMEAGEILKRGNSCFVSRIRLNGHDVVVKRYNHKGFWHSLRHTVKGSRAKKCWLFGHRLEGLDIASARPLGFLEQRTLGLVWQSYLLNEYVAGENIRTFMEHPETTDALRDEVSRKTRSLLDRLVHFGMTHGDLKAGNILISQKKPVLIDLDSMKRHRGPLLRLYQQRMNNDIDQRHILWKK
jgi:tRNA A-37 threonylcarbamoyl transferase component Bud32